jgi:hypothetical protein
MLIPALKHACRMAGSWTETFPVGQFAFWEIQACINNLRLEAISDVDVAVRDSLRRGTFLAVIRFRTAEILALRARGYRLLVDARSSNLKENQHE